LPYLFLKIRTAKVKGFGGYTSTWCDQFYGFLLKIRWFMRFGLVFWLFRRREDLKFPGSGGERGRKASSCQLRVSSCVGGEV
jgi:hypothetical protein